MLTVEHKKSDKMTASNGKAASLPVATVGVPQLVCAGAAFIARPSVKRAKQLRCPLPRWACRNWFVRGAVFIARPSVKRAKQLRC